MNLLAVLKLLQIFTCASFAGDARLLLLAASITCLAVGTCSFTFSAKVFEDTPCSENCNVDIRGKARFYGAFSTACGGLTFVLSLIF